MLFNIQHFAVFASISIFANALPFDTPRQIAPRQKNYSVINVDGGSSSDAAQATTVVKSTKTVEVINPGPTVTQETTTTVLSVAPAPTRKSSTTDCTTSAPSSTSTSSTKTSSSVVTSSSSKPVETPKPIFVTITVSKDDGPTEYYDNGLWHTLYRIKTFEAAVATLASSASMSSTIVAPILETPAPSYNVTSFQQYA
ncbi:hypothetical protein HBI56_178040 [Parastagonospora nodorum]|nr:hypothetical protein HBH53_244580 [Parastagonospora nodorum]KAH4004180.1 hypothetical protein HBI10_054000 [Parastagonospora nodorum]KAH4017047.1 hypothetical protein HBI13_146830 [Parastagonospora nodorum]KAH4038274.1 hypothetical protein HBI09_049140 [Parastagonospora nodorum]KAH4055310.1 hypothetical protein HBH49_057550 [Parastagonospora nodorum]